MRKMKKMLFAACTAALLSSSAFGQSADDLKRQSIQTSYLLALGKKATQAEVNYWMGQTINGDMVKTLYENHRTWLQGNPEVKKDMIRRSFKNSYGRTPSDSEVNTNMQKNWTYTDWMNNHSAWLKKTPGDYENAVRFAYQNVVSRQPSSTELTYWKGKGAMAYYVVASCVEQCKKSGNSSNCASNVFSASSRFADAIEVAPKVAASASGIIGSAAGNVIAPGGGNVIAPGGANVIAAGSMN
ncbi:MAG: hypothetical protein EOP46_15930 [Sphingobacteriaceae bacterium]|nr:MAG: hypothetical protein EOP46_15930 [Sphingobacteriaceae bacterium]